MKRKDHKKFKSTDYKKVESVVKIYQGIKEFCDLQLETG